MDYRIKKRLKDIGRITQNFRKKTAWKTLSILIFLVVGFSVVIGMYFLTVKLYEQPEVAVKVQSLLEWSESKLIGYAPPRTAQWFGYVEFMN